MIKRIHTDRNTYYTYIYKKRKERLNRGRKKNLTLSVRHKRSVYTLGYETAKEK